jgi:phosphate transport system substrate-binding protein
VINGTRLAALGGVALASALALTACGTDSNGTKSTTNSGASSSANGNCVKGTFNAAGSTAQQNAIAEWTKDYQQNCSGATLNYNANGSGSGVQAFLSGQVAFAGSDSALKPDEHTKADARCKTGKAVDLPMVTGPIAVVYNLKGVSGLQLSPATLAGIFAGKINKWNDPAIAKDNPGAKLPSSSIKTLHRSDDSGTTDNFTKYLTAAAKSVWTFPGGKKWTAPGGQGFKGSASLSTGLKQNDGTIGYVEMSFATNGNLSTAKIKNASGEFTALSTDSAAKSVAGATVVGTGDDLSLKIDYNNTVSGSYPIVLVTYEIACEKGLPASQASFVKSFLTYTSSQQGQSVLTNLGYAPLPDSVLTKVQNVVKGLS